MFSLRSRTSFTKVCVLLALAAAILAALLTAPSAHSGVGADSRVCTVPQVIEQQLGYAKYVIRKAHCRVGKIRRVRSAPHLKGRVLAQKPGVGRHLKRGARVNLVVGRGPRHR